MRKLGWCSGSEQGGCLPGYLEFNLLNVHKTQQQKNDKKVK